MEISSTLCTGCNALQQKIAEKDQEIYQLQQRIEELVRHDPLTGVLNRRSLIEMLQAELQRSHRTGHPFCFAMVNVDHFKILEQQYGVSAAENVLKNFSETSMKLLRALDRFGRISGEEFGIVLPATWLDQGMIAMQRLTRAVGDSSWEKIAPDLAITFCAGLTTNAIGDTADMILNRAQTALNAAKTQGRGQIVQMEEELSIPPPAADFI